MYKEYQNGMEFIKENDQYLSENKYLSNFFYYDAPLLKEINEENYAIKVENNNKKLLALKVSSYALMLYGDKSLLEEMLIIIKRKNYKCDKIMASSIIGEELMKISKSILNKSYYEFLGMDFMEASEFCEESSKLVTKASEEDVNEIYELLKSFIKDCHLDDVAKLESVKKNIDKYRIIKIDNKIVSMAIFSKNDNSYHISEVYTRDEYRERGYAKKVVNAVKNEILALGMKATLNVDKKNPISNHLYESLGFKKIFSQSVYYVKKSD